MSSTTQPTDFSDLYTSLMNKVRADTSVSTNIAQAKQYINTALIDMHIGYGEKFPWCERRAILRTQASYTTGTVSVSQGSTTVTGSGTAWNTNNSFSVKNVRAGGKIVFGGADIYEVASVSSDTSLTLASAFISSDINANSYTYFEDEYALASDFLRPIDWQHFTSAGEIELIGRTEFRRTFPRNNIPGTPRYATIVDLAFDGSTTRQRRIQFWQPPSTTLMLPYTYVTSNLAVSSAGTEAVSLSADTDEPIVPLQYRHVIVLGALVNWYRDKRDDTRSQEVLAEYERRIDRIGNDNEIGSPRPSIRPRLTSYAMKARTPWRGARSGSRYTVGSRFDEIR